MNMKTKKIKVNSYISQIVSLGPQHPAPPSAPPCPIDDPLPVPLLLEVAGHPLQEPGSKGPALVLGEVQGGEGQRVEGSVLHPAELKFLHFALKL